MKAIVRGLLVGGMLVIWSGCGDILPDVIPPFVIMVTPSDGETGVSVDTDVTILFSEPMDTATIDDTTFTVSGTTGTVVCDPLDMTAVFTPDSPLTGGTSYTVTLTTAVSDKAGNNLLSTYTSTFQTQ